MIQAFLQRIFTSTALVIVFLSSIKTHKINGRSTILSCDGFTIQSPMRSLTTRTLIATSKVKTNVAMEDFQFSLEVDGVDDDVNNRSGLLEEVNSSKGAPNQKPIRRQRRSKKVPLIAIVGRPNVGKKYMHCHDL